MLSEPDEVVVDRISERVADRVGIRPAARDVSEFLHGVQEPSLRSTTARPGHPPLPRPGPDPSPDPTFRPPGGSGNYSLTIEGRTWRFRVAKNALVFAFEWFARRDRTFLERFSTEVSGHTVRYVARDPSQIYRNQPERGRGASASLPGGWWIVVKNSTTRKENLIRRGCEIAGLRYGKDVIFDWPTRHRGRATAPPPKRSGAMSRRQRVMAALEAGEETGRREFKSSAFYSYQKPDVPPKTIFEGSVLKPVAGFLNATGGLLLIGVDDDARPIGIQKDLDLKKWTPEQYVRHLTDRIGQEMGQAAAARARVAITTVPNGDGSGSGYAAGDGSGEGSGAGSGSGYAEGDGSGEGSGAGSGDGSGSDEGKDICVVEVDPSPDPVWLTKVEKSGKRQAFYVRINNSTRELTGSDLLSYSRKRWD